MRPFRPGPPLDYDQVTPPLEVTPLMVTLRISRRRWVQWAVGFAVGVVAGGAAGLVRPLPATGRPAEVD